MTNKEAIEYIKSRCIGSASERDGTQWSDAMRTAIEALSEPKTGHWVEIEDYNGDIHYQCNQCKNEFILIDGTPQDNDYKFCPNCGAKMKGGEA